MQCYSPEESHEEIHIVELNFTCLDLVSPPFFPCYSSESLNTEGRVWAGVNFIFSLCAAGLLKQGCELDDLLGLWFLYGSD